jgi:hypothetical protein
MRGFGNGLEAAEFVGIGELVEALEAEKFEEKRGGLVEERPARLLGAAGDADDFPLEERGHDAVDGDSPHRFDLGAADGLAVGDDGEGFERGLAEPGRLGRIEELVGPDGELGAGLELETSRDALDHEARSVGLELGAEEVEGGVDFAGADFLVGGGFGSGGKFGRLVEDVGDGFGSQGPIRGEEQRFDNTGQVHPTIFGNLRQKARGENGWGLLSRRNMGVDLLPAADRFAG